MTALAAGGAVLLLSVTAVALWPRTYGTEATLVVDGGGRVANPVALAGRIEAALLEREQLAAAAMDLPPELRSPDPIGRLRAGIRVQSRGALGFSVEFRGSDPQSVQRIANRLADGAVAIMPKVAASPDDAASMKELAARSRAVSEFLTAHPEVAVEQPTESSPTAPASDGGLDLLRTEKRQLEQKLAAGAAADNPYADPGDDPSLLNLRLAELRTAISKREAALKQPRPASKAPASAELTSRWRTLLGDLASAQAKAAEASSHPLVTAHVTAKAPLPTSPLTPNRLVLSIVAVLLSLAAAMVAYILPRKLAGRPLARDGQRSRSEPPPNRGRSDPPPGVAPYPRSDPPPAMATHPRSEPPPALGPAPQHRSDPPRAGTGSEPPGPMAPQRTVVVTSTTASAAQPEKRSHTAPGGLEAPTADALAATALAAPPPRPSPPPAAPLFGSRPPPGAGSYSVSSSHPPPFETGTRNTRTAVERLSPLHSSRPPAASAQPHADRHPSPPPADAPQIMSRPPALDPDAERWAARFETPPPADQNDAPRKRSGRWTTQVMGSMVPLEVSAMREERAPPSSAAPATEARREARPAAQRIVPMAQPVQQPIADMIEHEVPVGWSPNVDPADATVLSLRDAILSQGLSQRLRVAVTGSAGNGKAKLASALALALAQAGARVLLIEADFDQPQLHLALGIEAPSGAGFSQQILARRQTQARPWTVVRCVPNLQVLAEGRMRSPGLLGSEDFESALRELDQQHHVVVIHAPALDRVSDLRTIDALAQVAVIARSREPVKIQFGASPLRDVLS